MKGKQLAILLALVVVLGGAGFVLQKGNQSAWSSSGGGAGSKVLDFPINDVSQVRLAAAGGDVNLVKKNEEWTVQERADFPANFEQVSSLLRKLWELKTVQDVKVGPSQMPRLELVEPGKGEKSGTLIELKDKEGKNLTSLLLGKNYVRKSEGDMMGMGGFPAGRYVTPVGSGRVSLVSETLEEVEPKPEPWLRKDFIKVEQPKAISVAGQTDAMRWTLNRDSATAEWKLADAKPEEQLDTSKVSSFATLFSNPSFKDVLAPDAKPEETGLDKPSTVTIETFDNFTYTLKIGKLTNDAYPVLVSVSANLAKERTLGKDEKPEDKARLDEEFKTKQKSLEDKLTAEKKFEGRPYLLEKNTVEPLLKERTALLVEKKPEPATTSTTPAPNNGAPTAVTTPPVSVTTPPVSVTSVPTPPVSVPPAPAPATPQETPAPAPPAAPAPAAPTPPAAESTAAPAPAPAPAAPTPPEPVSTPAQPASSAAPTSQPPVPPTQPAPPQPPTAEPAPPAPAPTPTPPAEPSASPAQPAPSAVPTSPLPQTAPRAQPAPKPEAPADTPSAPAPPAQAPSADPAPTPGTASPEANKPS